MADAVSALVHLNQPRQRLFRYCFVRTSCSGRLFPKRYHSISSIDDPKVSLVGTVRCRAEETFAGVAVQRDPERSATAGIRRIMLRHSM